MKDRDTILLERVFEEMAQTKSDKPRYLRIGKGVPKIGSIVLTTGNITDLLIVWGTVFGGEPMKLVQLTGDIVPQYKSYATGKEQYLLDKDDDSDKILMKLKKQAGTKFYLEDKDDYPLYTFDMDVFLIKVETVTILDNNLTWDPKIIPLVKRFT